MGEAHALAEQIRHMAENPREHSRMRQTCRELFLKKYTTQVCTAMYVDLLKEML